MYPCLASLAGPKMRKNHDCDVFGISYVDVLEANKLPLENVTAVRLERSMASCVIHMAWKRIE